MVQLIKIEFFGFLFISKNRIDIGKYLSQNKINLNDLLFVIVIGIYLHNYFHTKHGTKNLVFKSHGSIIKHNLDNILTCLRLKYFDKYKKG